MSLSDLNQNVSLYKVSISSSFYIYETKYIIAHMAWLLPYVAWAPFYGGKPRLIMLLRVLCTYLAIDRQYSAQGGLASAITIQIFN